MSVRPPSDQYCTWCASVQCAGIVHPGKVQPPSRNHNNRFCPGVKNRVARPSSSGSPSPPSITGMIPASQASLRTLAGDSTAPEAVTPPA